MAITKTLLRPANTNDDMRQRKAKLSRPAVILTPELRAVVLAELLDSLRRHNVEVLALSVSSMHLHVLARFPEQPTFGERGLREKRTSAVDDPARHFLGLAKQWSSKNLIRAGVIDAPLWAKRDKIISVADRTHQVNALNYILGHVDEGAAMWSFRDPDPAPISLPWKTEFHE